MNKPHFDTFLKTFISSLIFTAIFFISFGLYLIVTIINPVNLLYFTLLITGVGFFVLDRPRQPGAIFKFQSHINFTGKNRFLMSVFFFVILTPLIIDSLVTWILTSIIIIVIFNFWSIIYSLTHNFSSIGWKKVIIYSAIAVSIAISTILIKPVSNVTVGIPVSIMNTEFQQMQSRLKSNSFNPLDRMRMRFYMGAIPLILHSMGLHTGAVIKDCFLHGILPPDFIIEIWREKFMKNKKFISLLKTHQKAAVANYRHSGVYIKRYILHGIDLEFFGAPGAKDDWAFRARTDIVDGKPYTSYLFRPGIIFDPNAAEFFGDYNLRVLGETLIFPVYIYMESIRRYQIGRSFFINFTDSPETSQISRKRLDYNIWLEKSAELHKRKSGLSFP